MTVTMLRTKIHQGVLTKTRLNYVGSISIDQDLIEAVGLFPYEKVQVVNSNNGDRLETYVIPAAAGSGAIELNGAAARNGVAGDRLIIMSYAQMSIAEAKTHQPKVAILDQRNQIVEIFLYDHLLAEQAERPALI
ncbi:MAG: aspartate 1-decarboxylase [Aphanocapsa sp. GSE-SYN-MK-11-07L]|nr:aspartate 1-decarboxylase [Aphanocapsa sp. GSE-SYN-MK-11-07L]